MHKKLSVLLLIFLVSQMHVNAQSLSDIPGSFVDVGFGSRPAGLGFAFVGLADDENSVYWNPAGLGQIDGISAGFSQADQLGLISYSNASIIVPFRKNQSFGISVIQSGDDALEELSINASYGIKLSQFSLGFSVKYRNATFGNNTLNREDYIVFDDTEFEDGVNQQVFGDANGFGVDLGLIYKPTSRLQFGVLVRDAYAPMDWESEARGVEYQARGKYEEELPLDVIIGSSFIISNNLLLVTDFQPARSDERTDWVRVGLEGRLVKVLMLRAGTEQGINDFDDERFTLGTGLNLELRDKIRLRADYAYIIDPIQNSQRIGFSISF